MRKIFKPKRGRKKNNAKKKKKKKEQKMRKISERLGGRRGEGRGRNEQKSNLGQLIKKQTQNMA